MSPSGPPSTGVVTVVHSSQKKLVALHESLSKGSQVPDLLVVVALDDAPLVAWAPDDGVAVHVVPMSATPDGLPWAAARNSGAVTALAAEIEVLLFIDATGPADPALVAALVEAVDREPLTLWTGEAPFSGGPVDEPSVLALSREAWSRTGGFCEDYVGRGFEVLDLVQVAARAGISLGHVAVPTVAVADDAEREETAASLERSAALYEQRWGTAPTH